MAEIAHWRGFRELEQNLKHLGEEMRERGVKLMMARAAVPMRDEAKRRVPVLAVPHPHRLAGTVRRAIGIWRKRRSPYAVTYYVGVRQLSRSALRKFVKDTGQLLGRFNPNDPFYWRFLEFGTSKMAARPFLRPAFEAKKMESVRIAAKVGADFVRTTAGQFKRTSAAGGGAVRITSDGAAAAVFGSAGSDREFRRLFLLHKGRVASG